MKKLRIGVIGAGEYATRYHIPNLLAHANAEIVAVCDVSAGRLGHALAVIGGAHGYSDYRAMLTAEGVDAVTVSSPHAFHFDQTMCALEHGAHVLVDKHFVLRTREATQLLHSAANRGLTLMVSLNRHLDPANVAARRLITSGAIGDVYHARSMQVGKPSYGSFADPRLSGGGPLVSRGTHMAALIPWLTGWRPVTVSAEIVPAPHEAVDDGGVITVGFDGGRVAEITSVRSGFRYVDEVEVLGSRGRVMVQRHSVAGDWELVVEDQGGVKAHPVTQDGTTVTAHFVDVISGRCQPVVPIQHAVDAVAIIEAAYESARTQQRVMLSGAGER